MTNFNVEETLAKMERYIVYGNYIEYNNLKNQLLDYIKELKKDNNDLRRIYLNTAKKLEENGNDELARYFLAQIDMTPTFTVDPAIDYYKEYYKLLDKIKWLEQEIDDLEMQIGNKDV